MRPEISEETAEKVSARIQHKLTGVDASELTFDQQVQVLLEAYDEHQPGGRKFG